MSKRLEQLFSLKGKVALVTGAGTGMGRRFSQTLAEAGAKVVCVARNRERLEEVAEAIRADGGAAVAVAGDVGDSASVEAIFDQAEQAFGRVNLLVNSAAQVDFGVFPDVKDENWQTLINVNLSGIMRTCRSFSRRLIAAREPGAIVNITSIIGTQVMGGVPAYGTLKAAANQLTRSMAKDLFEHRIRVNALAPGYFQTEMSAPLWDTDAGKAAIERHPLKRTGRVEELDGPLLLLASDASAHVNGAVLTVDAGHSIQLY
ncbi:MAG: putative dehydrogenase like [Panacagrimonas sp.]|jgi:NAD(P)-dependent dehydrogenase (short-subunit alcohol dehydrogenase family)|nr:SDR family oxidoreductase [Panacagrimonas sp.]MCC2655260.1 putative dehydrogenase like [Panacagrimonas sp.]